MLPPLGGGYGQSRFSFCLGAAKTNLEGGLPPLCRPLFRGKGLGLTKEAGKLLLAPPWGTNTSLVLEQATSWASKHSKTSEASWEDTMSGTLKAKGGRVGSPLLCASSSLTLPPWSCITVVHVRSDSALLNGETLCTIWDILEPTLSVAFNLK